MQGIKKNQNPKNKQKTLSQSETLRGGKEKWLYGKIMVQIGSKPK